MGARLLLEELQPLFRGRSEVAASKARVGRAEAGGRAAHKLKAVLDGLGARSEFHFLPGRTHMDLYVQGKDRQGLLKQMAWEMYAVARPQSELKRVAAKP